MLVTGAGGLIGSALVRRLYAAGVAVHAHVGPPGFEGLPLPRGVPVSWCDVLDLGPLVADAGVDAVVHLAGPAGVAASFADPATYARDHVEGTAAVLAGLAAVRRPQHLVYVSSAEVYGRPAHNPVDESAASDPLSPYAAAKVAAESLVRSQRPNATVLRPFSVYGDSSPARSLVGSLVRQAISSDRIEVATLAPVRDYVHVDDLVRAVEGALERRPAGAFNVGSGVGTSVRELAHLAIAVTGRPLPLVEAGADRPIDVLELVADIRRSAERLGWAPTVDLRSGLEQAIRARRRS